MTDHPSYLRLDRHALGVHDAEIATHAEACETCSRYLASLTPAAPLPAWVIEEERPSLRRWSVPAIAIAAAVAGVYLSMSTVENDYVGVKGTPAVVVYKKSGDGVTRWKGEAVHAGEALQLGLIGATFDHAAILTPVQGQMRVVYRGEVGAQEALVPQSLNIDDRGDRERIIVIFSAEPLTDPALMDAATSLPSNEAVHAIDLELRKVEL